MSAVAAWFVLLLLGAVAWRLVDAVLPACRFRPTRDPWGSSPTAERPRWPGSEDGAGGDDGADGGGD